jgi:amino acid adenylation domain-containing protein
MEHEVRATADPVLHEQVGRDPSRVAVRAGTSTLTFAELDDAATRLARHLRSRGARTDTVTAIRLARGPDLPVAILAALKAGTGYLPLDSRHPVERHRRLLADTGARLLLTTAEHGLDTDVETVLLDDPRVDRERAARLDVRVRPENLAYVLPTSGTTGSPKAVAVSHRAAVNTLRFLGSDLGLGPGDTVLQLADISYSAAVRDVLGPLVNGATLELLTGVGAGAVEAVADRLAAGGVTCLLSCLPQVLSALLDLGAPRGDLRLALVISEPLTAPLAARARRAWGPRVRLVHQYGLTECAMTSLAGDVLADPRTGRVPVGRPIPDTEVHLLDRQLQPVPPGTVGELYVGGAGLARGYQGQPALTAAWFVPDPFRPGGRLYRTGDLARQRPDGAVECLGRTDRQIKLRGYRVELDEIELTLQASPALRAAAVQSYQHGGEPVVVGHVVPRDGKAVDAADLTAHLARTLPQPMTALRFVTVDELPTLPNGKLDRRALVWPPPDAPGDAPPAADATPPAAPPAIAAAATPSDAAAAAAPPDASGIEDVVAETWRGVLGLPDLPRDADVFAAGAHSIHVVRVTAQLHRTVSAHVRVQDVFEHPSVAALAGWLAGSSAPPAPAPPVSPAPARKASQARRRPATAAERSLWFVDRLRPGSAAYVIAFALDVEGSLDAAPLQTAVEQVVRRHPALRTTFDDDGGEPVAVVHAEPRFDFAETDVEEAGWPAQPFDLTAGPLLRVAVRPDGTRAWFAVHHIVADDWSVGVFLRDLATAYGGGELPAAGAAPDGPRPTPPSDWLNRLRAVPPLVQLPGDRLPPAARTDRGGVVWRTLPAPLVDSVRRLAQAQRATPFMVVLAAWSLLLSRWCGQEGLVVGTLSAGRAALEAGDAVGLFVNTIPVPVRVAGERRFDQLLGEVRTSLLDALQHADVPFEHLVEMLAPPRATSHEPLVQVVCDWVDEPPERWRLAGTNARLRDIEPATAKFDLWLSVRRRGDDVRARLEYREDLFTRPAIERLADRLVTVLCSVTADPGRPVATVTVLPPAEAEQVVARWNDTAVPGEAGSVLDRIRGHGGIALRHGTRSLTYGQLLDAADRLAGHLRASGLGTDDVVALCLPRTPQLVTAILAVLEAGAAYVPLDPAYPPARLADTLARVRPVALLTDRATRPAVAVAPRTRVIELDTVHLPEPDAGRSGAPHPASLAYVLSTSGSTGAPKGVALSHRGVLNLVDWARRAFSAEELSCVAAGTSVCFDLSVFELLVPLAAGGTVELLDDLLSLPGSPAAARVTLVNTVPSAIEALLDSRPELPALRRVNVAGEPLRPDLVRRIASALPGRPVTNLYGPTETTTYSTAAACRPGELVTIGRPITNTRVYLLDRHRQPVPPGTVAEVYIGGAGVARGYYRQPAATAERFVPDPFVTGGRLYRTGDLARQLPDGRIVHLGRTDRQVKIRGHRVEPAEVEAALHRHPGVRRAVVGPHPEPSGTPRLLGWVVLDPSTGDSVDGGELRRFLATTLPGFLVPSVLTVVDAIPVTLNGKVDWAALPPPRPGPTPRGDAAAGDGEARTPTVAEQAVGRLWRELLRADDIGVDSHFFELGAHSILATRLIARVNETFGVELPVSTIFAAPRLGDFARRLEDAVLRDIIERRRGDRGDE